MIFFLKLYNKIDILISKLFISLINIIPFFSFIKGTSSAQVSISFKHWFRQFFFHKQYRFVYWPIHPSSEVSYFKKILIGVDTCPGYMPGCYIHGVNGIIIGDYTQISSNVGIQSGNHDIHDLRKQIVGKPIKIGSYCWIGMNAMILAEVELGDFTIVGAGAVVTKSFPEGYCVIAGNPAKKIRDLDKSKCKKYKYNQEYIGFIKKENFSQYRKKNLII